MGDQNASADMSIELQDLEGRMLQTRTLSSPRAGFGCTLVHFRDLSGDREPGVARIDVLVKRTLNVVGIDRSNVVESMDLVNEIGETQVRYPKWSWMARVLP